MISDANPGISLPLLHLTRKQDIISLRQAPASFLGQPIREGAGGRGVWGHFQRVIPAPKPLRGKCEGEMEIAPGEEDVFLLRNRTQMQCVVSDEGR